MYFYGSSNFDGWCWPSKLAYRPKCATSWFILTHGLTVVPKLVGKIVKENKIIGEETQYCPLILAAREWQQSRGNAIIIRLSVHILFGDIATVMTADNHHYSDGALISMSIISQQRIRSVTSATLYTQHKCWIWRNFCIYSYASCSAQHTDFNEGTTNESASVAAGACSNVQLWKMDIQKEWRNTSWRLWDERAEKDCAGFVKFVYSNER